MQHHSEQGRRIGASAAFVGLVCLSRFLVGADAGSFGAGVPPYEAGPGDRIDWSAPSLAEVLRDKLRTWRSVLDADAYSIGGRSTIVSGFALNVETGAVAVEGDRIDRGPWWFLIDSEVEMTAGDRTFAVEYERGELLATHEGFDLASPGWDECSISCRDSGSYACCWGENGVARCKCIANRHDDSRCQSGGRGADRCSIGRGRRELE